MTESHMVDEAAELGAEPFPQAPMETQRWAMPSDLPYAYVEYSGVNMDLKHLMQRQSNIIAAMRRVRDANELPVASTPAPSAPQNVAQRPQPAPSPTPQQQTPREPFYNAQGEPCCPVHKGRDGQPRTMRFFEANQHGPANYKCTAKKRDGSYCEISAPAA